MCSREKSRRSWPEVKAVCVVLLCVVAQFGVSAQEKERAPVVAVLALDSPSGESVGFDFLHGFQARLEVREGDGGVMEHDSSINRLSVPALSYNETLAKTGTMALNAAVDSWYHQMPDAERALAEAIADMDDKFIMLVLDDALSSSFRTAQLTLALGFTDSARFDEAEVVLMELVSTFPTYVPSQRAAHPKVVSAIGTSKSVLSTPGTALLVEAHGQAQECDLNLNGITTNIGVGKEIPVAAGRDYGVMFTCSGQSTLPMLLSIKALKTKLPVGLELVESLAPLEEGKPPALVEDESLRLAQVQLLRSLLGVPTLYVLSPSESGLWVARADEQGTRQALASSAAEAGLNAEIIRALEAGKPTEDVAVNLGAGWIRPEEKSYLIEWIVIGTGLAVGVAGAALVGVGASQAADLEACVGRTPPCTESEFADLSEGPTTFVVAGHALWASGAALALGGATVLLVRALSGADDEDSGEFGFGLVPGGAAATWRVQW